MQLTIFREIGVVSIEILSSKYLWLVQKYKCANVHYSREECNAILRYNVYDV